MYRRLILATLAILFGATAGCGGPSVNESLSKDFTIHSPDKAVTVEVADLEGDGEGKASVDYGDRDALKVLPFSTRYQLDKEPRDASDVQVSYARLTVEQPEDADLDAVHSIHVYLLPKGASWHDSSDWRRVAVARGFPQGSRTIDFDILSKPTNVSQFIQEDDDGLEVWVGIYVVLDEEVELRAGGMEVSVDMDLSISI
ncbi:MAG: hypothetical protein ACQEVA_12840 [Myxococcota bacterium]